MHVLLRRGLSPPQPSLPLPLHLPTISLCFFNRFCGVPLPLLLTSLFSLPLPPSFPSSPATLEPSPPQPITFPLHTDRPMQCRTRSPPSIPQNNLLIPHHPVYYMIPCALFPHPFHPTRLLRRSELVIITKTMNLTAKVRYLLHSTSGFCFFFSFFPF